MSSFNITKDIVSAANILNWQTTLFSRCFCIIMFILGFIGHSLNIYVFTRPIFYSVPCARYLLTSSIIGYFIIFVNLPIRFVQFGYNWSLFATAIGMCKVFSFLFFLIRYLQEIIKYN